MNLFDFFFERIAVAAVVINASQLHKRIDWNEVLGQWLQQKKKNKLTDMRNIKNEEAHIFHVCIGC